MATPIGARGHTDKRPIRRRRGRDRRQLAADLTGPDRKVTPAWLLFGEDGGLQLVKSSTSTTAAGNKSKRSRAAKVVGAVALAGSLLGIPAVASAMGGDRADISTIMTTRRRAARRGAAAAQLPLDLVAA